MEGVFWRGVLGLKGDGGGDDEGLIAVEVEVWYGLGVRYWDILIVVLIIMIVCYNSLIFVKNTEHDTCTSGLSFLLNQFG